MSSKSARRLVDYFLVVTFQQQLNSDQLLDGKFTAIASTEGNSKKLVADNSALEFHPIIAARYPLTDHEGSPLHESVTCFCHPQGYVRPRKLPALPKVFFFISFII